MPSPPVDRIPAAARSRGPRPATRWLACGAASLALVLFACSKNEPAKDTAAPIRAEIEVPVGEAAGHGSYTVVVSQPGSAEQKITGEREGRIQTRMVADVTGDGAPEILVWMTAGANAQGTMHVYESHAGTWSRRPLVDLAPEQREGYRGHDVFAVENGALSRRYPEYASSHPDATPNGTSVHLVYSFTSDRWMPVP